MPRTTWLLLLIAPAAGLWGCGDDSTAPPPPPSPPPSPASPSLSAISPNYTISGSPDITLTIAGANFTEDPHGRSAAAWLANGDTTLLSTSFVSPSRLTAVIPAALLSDTVTAQVFLETGDPTGDLPLSPSKAVSFRVQARPKPTAYAPSIAAISPTAVLPGSADLELTITGLNFVGDSDARSEAVWMANGDTTVLSTTFVSANQLTAIIPAALLSQSVNAQVFVELEHLPWLRSRPVGFSVAAAGSIIVYGQPNSAPGFIRGWREVALDAGAWQTLREGQSIIFPQVGPGTHQLWLSNPCTSTHTPTITSVTVTGSDPITVTVIIPPDCE